MIYDKLVKTAEDQKLLLNEILITHTQAIQDLAQEIVKTFHGDGRLLLLASGTLGSVATLVANLFAHRLANDRPMLPAIDLCQNTTLATSLMPSPSQFTVIPKCAKARSTNSRTECCSPVAIT